MMLMVLNALGFCLTFTKDKRKAIGTGLGLIDDLFGENALLSFFKELSLQLKLIGIIGEGGLLENA